MQKPQRIIFLLSLQFSGLAGCHDHCLCSLSDFMTAQKYFYWPEYSQLFSESLKKQAKCLLDFIERFFEQPFCIIHMERRMWRIYETVIQSDHTFPPYFIILLLQKLILSAHPIFFCNLVHYAKKTCLSQFSLLMLVFQPFHVFSNFLMASKKFKEQSHSLSGPSSHAHLLPPILLLTFSDRTTVAN